MANLSNYKTTASAPTVPASSGERRIMELEQFVLDHRNVRGPLLLLMFEHNQNKKRKPDQPCGNPADNEQHILHSFSGRGGYVD